MAASGFPRWAWRASLAALVGAALLVALLLGLALGGAGEVKPVGTLMLDRAPADTVNVPDSGVRLFAPLDAALRPPGSAELTLTLTDGPAESGYGVWAAGDRGDTLAVAVTGTGYYGAFVLGAGDAGRLDDWRPYPHVRPAGQPNRIRLDVRGSILEVRVNDELAGAYPFRGALGEVGVYVETFEEGGATVTPVRLRLWSLYPEP